MNCQFLKQDPKNPDHYICHKIIGSCIGKPKECPAYKQLLKELFEEEEKLNDNP